MSDRAHGAASRGNPAGAELAPHTSLPVSPDDYPWLPRDAEVPASLVSLGGGTDFYYGSMIGLNGTVRKIAGSVPGPESEGLQDTLFAALPDTLGGRPNSRVTKAYSLGGLDRTLLIVTKQSLRASGLVFAVESGMESEESGPKTVLRVGISTGKDYPKLMRLLGIKNGRC